MSRVGQQLIDTLGLLVFLSAGSPFASLLLHQHALFLLSLGRAYKGFESEIVSGVSIFLQAVGSTTYRSPELNGDVELLCAFAKTVASSTLDERVSAAYSRIRHVI